MALSPKVVDAMVAAGCTVEQLAAAVKADSAETLEREAEQRERARQRQRKSRENRKANKNNGHVTVTPVTGCDIGDNPPHTPPSNNPPPPKGGLPPTKITKSTGTRLPDDWTLPEEWRQWALNRGVPPDVIDAQAFRFRNHWTTKSGKDATKVRWDRTWQNWITDKRGYSGNGAKQQKSTVEDTARAAARAFGVELPERERGKGESFDGPFVDLPRSAWQ